MFSGGIEIEHCLEMGYTIDKQILIGALRNSP